MRTSPFRWSTAGVAFAAGVLCAAASHAQAQPAQNYPARPVTLVVPFNAGGASDVLMRVVAQQLGKRLGGTFVVENRPGANGNIGMAYLANAAADGYTIGATATATLATNPAIYKKLPYDATKDFASIALVGMMTSCLVISPSVQAGTVAELVALMKAKRTSFAFGSPGIGNPAHLAGELFKRSAGVEMQHVPYRGGNEIMRDLIGGQIQVAFSPLIESLPYIRSGQIRALGVTRGQRSAHLPDVPTITEGGVAGVEYASWQGLAGPRAMPPAVVETLNEAVRAILGEPELRETLRRLVIDPVAMTPQELEAFLVAERAKWSEVAAQSGVRLD